MNKTYLIKFSSFVLSILSVVLLSGKFYYMKGANYPISDLRDYRREYRDLFEYDLSLNDRMYWTKVVSNYNELNDVRMNLLKKKLNKEQWKELSVSIKFLQVILTDKTPLVPRRVKDNIILFKRKNIYEYLYELQSPVLDQGQIK